MGACLHKCITRLRSRGLDWSQTRGKYIATCDQLNSQLDVLEKRQLIKQSEVTRLMLAANGMVQDVKKRGTPETPNEQQQLKTLMRKIQKKQQEIQSDGMISSVISQKQQQLSDLLSYRDAAHQITQSLQGLGELGIDVENVEEQLLKGNDISGEIENVTNAVTDRLAAMRDSTDTEPHIGFTNLPFPNLTAPITTPGVIELASVAATTHTPTTTTPNTTTTTTTTTTQTLNNSILGANQLQLF